VLAFHVDYWNHLGWDDPFSMPHYTRRQYDYARKRGTRTVYTPQVILNGAEFRRWHAAGAEADIAAAAQGPAGATIALSVRAVGERDLDVEATISNVAAAGEPMLYLALYENGLTNRIEDGENAGRTLHHDFVTRRLLGPFPVDAKSPATIKQRIQVDREWHKANMGVVAFIQRDSDNRVLQSLARPLCALK